MSSAPRLKILIAEPDGFDAEAVSLLRTRADVELRAVDDEGLVAAFAEFDAVWVRLAHRVDAVTLSRADRCRVLACGVTGLDHIDLAECGRRGIRVVSLKGEVEFLRNVRATAELTIALILALLRNIPAAARSVIDGCWNRDLFRGGELHEKTVGLVGVGRLGTIVASLLAGFGASVIAFDPRPDLPPGVERAANLDVLLARSEIVSVHVSYDSTTRHLLGARELRLMRRDALLVNTSRGGVLDESALLEALREGRLAGAALDVLEGEPLLDLSAHPLIEHARNNDNLLIVPHIGGNTRESLRKTERFVAQKVLAALTAGSA